MNNSDIIIIGAGAAGLMAAYTLRKSNKTVIILEARNRLGGRIHTLENTSFSQPVEAGAEFIHGRLPLTLELHQEANISYRETGGERWRMKNQTLTKTEDFIEQGDLLFKHLDELQEDITIANFLNRYFSDDKYAGLRSSIKSFVEGYDAADIGKASAFALREEWEGEDEHQFRPVGGYGKMIRFLADECTHSGCKIILSAAVTTVNWKAGRLEVFTGSDQLYTTQKLIVTVPVSVLQAQFPATGAIRFNPQLTDQMNACQNIGIGHVIKILLEFDTAILNEGQVVRHTGADLSGAAWIFSGEPVPTWWTQLPEKNNLLTGWLAGPRAEALASASDEEILDMSIRSLANILSLPADNLKQQVKASHVFNWTADPFARCAYAYNTLLTIEARKILTTSIEDTIYFAGEALYDGPQMGTVEGALSSGKRAAEEAMEEKQEKNFLK